MKYHLRRNPSEVRLILAHYDKFGSRRTLQEFGLQAKSLYRWLRWRTESGDPNWPPPSEDAHWLSTRTERERRAKWMHEYRKRKYLGDPALTVDATGTRRRIQALMRMGWSGAQIAELAGWTTAAAVHETTKRTRVKNATRDRIADAYDKLSMQVGPSAITRAWAEKQGWPPPLAWDDIDNPDEKPKGTGLTVHATLGIDETAITRRLDGGHPTPLRSKEERDEIVRRLHRLRLSDAEIARRAGLTPRTVLRVRQRLDLPAWYGAGRNLRSEAAS